MLFKNFNDFLAVILVCLIVCLWVLQGRGIILAMPEISGATIATFTIIVQYYFRRAPPTNGGVVPPANGGSPNG